MMNENLMPRSILAYFWSIIAAVIMVYIVYRWGDKMEILTLIIGLVGGTILGGIFGVYFGANHKTPTLQDTQKTTIESSSDGTTITTTEPVQ